MALIIEDGTGKADAEAYRSVADHKTWCAARGISFDASDAVLEQQARLAVDYMTGQYRGRWAGYRVLSIQALDFPRYEVPKRDAPGGYRSYPAYYPSNSVPVEVQNAQSELMVRVANGDLAPDLTRGVLREKIGPIETEYDPNSAQSPRYPAVDRLLSPLLAVGGSTVRVARA